MTIRTELLRERYPSGTRIRLVAMDDVQAPKAGTLGTVVCVDGVGTIHVNWDTGSSLGLVLEAGDRFEVVNK